MSSPLIFAIDSLDFKTASIQANLLASRLSSPELKVKVVDLLKPGSGTLSVYKDYLKGSYGHPDELTPYDVAQLLGPQLKSDANILLKTSKRLQAVVLTGYGSVVTLAQANKFVSESERLGFYMWYDNYLFYELKIIRPDLHILIKSGVEDARIVDELSKLMPHSFVKAEGYALGTTSIANLNNQILGLIKAHLDQRHLSNQQTIAAISKANDLIAQNIKIAKQTAHTQNEKLVPIGECRIKRNLRPKMRLSENIYDSFTPVVKIAEIFPKNELMLVKNHQRLSYLNKSRKLIEQTKTNPAELKAKYKITLTSSFDELYNSLSFLPSDCFSSIVLKSPIADDYDYDNFLCRHIRIVLAIEQSIPIVQQLELMPAGAISAFNLELNYVQLNKAVSKMKISPSLEPLADNLTQQLASLHPLLWGF